MTAVAPPLLSRIVDRMSASKLELFERCPEAFRARYVEGLRAPPRASNALGNAVDATTNAVYFAKLQSRETLAAKDCVDRFANWWDIEAAKVAEWGEDSKGDLLDVGVRGVTHWRERVATRVQPTREPQVTVEFRVCSQHAGADQAEGLASEWDVVGVFDVVGEVPRPDGSRATAIIDHKASGKTWSASDVLRSAQPPVYRRGTGVELFQFHVLRTGLKEAQTMVVSQVVPELAVAHVVHRMELARRAIARCLRTGDWIPNRNQTLCSWRWCGYAEQCERRHGGVVAP